MQDIATFKPGRTDPVLVAWLDQFGQQVTFIAARANDGHWYANGSRIGQPTHWDEIPRIQDARIPARGSPPARLTAHGWARGRGASPSR